MANTVIGSSVVIDGEVTGEDDLLILGKVKGRISVRDHIEIDHGGLVEANVESRSIKVSGAVTGDINAEERAELRQDCQVIGDVRAPRVHIADGASFKGNVDMGG